MIKGVLNKQQFLDMVMIEINCLRDNATQAEKDRLDFSSFHFALPSACIYGQMTGSCGSPRAKELYPKTLNKIMTREDIIHYNEHDEFLVTMGDGYTALENYLFVSADITETTTNSMFLCGESSVKHKEIIEFIKGERHMLTL